MTTLIIPDIHNHIDSAEEWVADYPADQVVFLGDYFDNVGDTPEIAAHTASWLRDSLTDPRRIHLWGNHDLPYAIPANLELFCPGFSPEKSIRVSGILNWEDHWQHLKLVHFQGDFALSHAGIARSVFETRTPAAIEDQCRVALEKTRRCESPLDPVFGFSGIVWQRWWGMDHLPEFHQIVGHSPLEAANVEWEHGRLNVDLDTYGRYLGWIDDADVFHLVETETREMIRVGPPES